MPFSSRNSTLSPYILLPSVVKRSPASSRHSQSGQLMLSSVSVGKPPAIRVFTVSYTHLRAHETKANIVCRLLLEKKKKTKKHKKLLIFQSITQLHKTISTPYN